MTIRRLCWCKTCPQTCLVHILGGYVEGLARGCRVFPNISIETARAGLKQMLDELGVATASTAHLQDLRRGHAEDIRAAGGGDEALCLAGGWKRKSRAVLYYLDLEQLELECCLRAHCPEADDSGTEDD